MYSNVRSIFLLTAIFSSFTAFADDVPLDIKTDLKGAYFLVKKAGSSDRPTLMIKSVSGDYINYSKREFDCKARTSRFLSTGVSLQQLQEIKPVSKMSSIVADSINDQLWRLACTKK